MICKQQIRRQMSWYVSKKDLLKVSIDCQKHLWYTHFDDILLLTWRKLANRLHRKSTSKKKIQIKALYRILGTGISRYEEFHWQISEENESYTAKWKYSQQLTLCNNAWWNERWRIRNNVYVLIFSCFRFMIQLW